MNKAWLKEFNECKSGSEMIISTFWICNFLSHCQRKPQPAEPMQNNTTADEKSSQVCKPCAGDIFYMQTDRRDAAADSVQKTDYLLSLCNVLHSAQGDEEVHTAFVLIDLPVTITLSPETDSTRRAENFDISQSCGPGHIYMCQVGHTRMMGLSREQGRVRAAPHCQSPRAHCHAPGRAQSH